MLQPVFRSDNDLSHRLRKLEAERSDREHALEQEIRRATGALLTQSRQRTSYAMSSSAACCLPAVPGSRSAG